MQASEKPKKIHNPYSPSNFIGKYLIISGIGMALNISGFKLIKNKGIAGDKALGKFGIVIGTCFLAFAYNEYRQDKKNMNLYLSTIEVNNNLIKQNNLIRQKNLINQHTNVQ